MSSRVAGSIILAALCFSFALAGDGLDVEKVPKKRDGTEKNVDYEVRKERDWTVKELPRHPRHGTVLPISNEIILQNSLALLKEHPDDKELKKQITQFAMTLARPKAPSPVAWQTLIEQGVLKDGMSMIKARGILGPPTYEKEGDVRWYFNYDGQHVFPGLAAEVEDGTLKNWGVFEG
jgi:hypothetical protein